MSTNIAFVDSRVAGYRTLVAGMPANTEVVFLEPGSDGLEQIAAYLEGREGITGLHLISHGRPGSLHLSGGVLDNENIAGYASQLARIGRSLEANADLLIYGCNVAQGEAGAAFVRELATLTGADVAASDDPTGAAARGGDAVLEVATG